MGGRALQGPKLAPTVSPNKTWSGLCCGLLAGSLWCALYGTFSGYHGAIELALGCLIPLAATLGDLLASKGKRMLGAKDSSTIIPGHGGLWDRLDSTIGVIWLLSILTTLWPALIGRLSTF